MSHAVLSSPHLEQGFSAAEFGVHLSQRAGLGDAREAALLRRLQDEAQGLAGELVLGHLCEAAQVGDSRVGSRVLRD